MGFLAALIPAIASIGSLAGAGVGLAEAAMAPGAAATPAAPTPTPPTANQLLQQKALVSQALPNVLSSTSGLANPAYDSLIAQILAGTLGQPGSTAAGQYAAGGGPSAPGTGQSFSLANAQPTNAAVTGNDIGLSNYIQAGT